MKAIQNQELRETEATQNLERIYANCIPLFWSQIGATREAIWNQEKRNPMFLWFAPTSLLVFYESFSGFTSSTNFVKTDLRLLLFCMASRFVITL